MVVVSARNINSIIIHIIIDPMSEPAVTVPVSPFVIIVIVITITVATRRFCYTCLRFALPEPEGPATKLGSCRRLPRDSYKGSRKTLLNLNS